MKTELYTCMFDYVGGTYISQVHAKSVKDAIHTWIEEVDTKAIYGMGEKSRADMKCQLIEKELDNEGYVAISECKNIWIDCFRLRRGLGILHIILTKERIS